MSGVSPDWNDSWNRRGEIRVFDWSSGEIGQVCKAGGLGRTTYELILRGYWWGE